MSDKSSQDLRLARELNATPDEINATREQWARNRIMQHIIRDELKSDLERRRTELETISADSLLKKQGEIQGIRFAMGIVFKKET